MGLGSDGSYRDETLKGQTAGISHVIRSLAYPQDHARIRVNCVCPGWVATALSDHVLDSVPEGARAAYQRQLVRPPQPRTGRRGQDPSVLYAHDTAKYQHRYRMWPQYGMIQPRLAGGSTCAEAMYGYAGSG